MLVARDDALRIGLLSERHEVVISRIGGHARLRRRIADQYGILDQAGQGRIDMDAVDRRMELGSNQDLLQLGQQQWLTIRSKSPSAHWSRICPGPPFGESSAETKTLQSRTTRGTQRREGCCSWTATPMASSSLMPAPAARRSARMALTRSRPLSIAR